MSLLGRRIGNYEIRAKIGEGGMGTVWLGEHPLIGKRVAIKVLLEELVAKEEVVSRFFHEAKAVNDIGHLNIVDIVDFGKMPGERGQELVYFIMEYLDGEALSTRIRRAGLPFKDTLHIIGQCCSALSASHGKGIVHRDLKPENIFLVTRGGDPNFAKLLDFGIAKLTGDTGTSSHKTRTGLVIGTPTYMSPEQCEGKGHIDHRSDVYSLGIVMYELLTGAVPFPGEGFGEVLVAHLTKPPPPLTSVNPNVPPALEAIVMHAIEKDRNRRFQTMEEFLAAVHDPEAHLAAYRPLPGHAAPTAIMPVAQPIDAKSGRTLSLDDVGPAVAGGPPRPTTLEGAAAEVTLPPTRRPGRRTSLVAIAAAATALVAVGGWLALSKKDKPTNEAAASMPEAKPPAADVIVTVVSDPAGAKVYRADKSEAETDTTPITFKLKKGAPPFDIQLRLDGYKPETRTVTSDQSMKLVVALAQLPSAAPPVAAAAAPAPVRAAPTPAKAEPAAGSNVSKPHHEHRKTAPKTSAPVDDDGNGIMKPNW